MTDKPTPTPTPTDAELKAMWQLHAADIGGIFYYARAVLAKWGQPAQTGEAVALDHIAAIEVGELRYVTGRKAPAYDCELYAMPDGKRAPVLFAAPQPVAREPLTDEQIHAIYDEVARREPYAGAVTRRNIVRAIEAAHGIKGGQHGDAKP